MAFIGWFSIKIPLYLQPGWNLRFKDLQILTLDGAVAQSAVENQNDKGVLDFQGPAERRDRADQGETYRSK